MADRNGKRAMTRAAKLFVSELIHNQDLPDWLYDHFGVDIHEADERDFMEAIERLSSRLQQESIPSRN